MKALRGPLGLLATLLLSVPALADPQDSMPGMRPHNGMQTLSRLNVKQSIAPLTGDGCIVCVQDAGKTAFQVYSPMYAPGAVQYDGIRSVLQISSGKAYNMNGIASYIQNGNPFNGVFGAGVAFFAMANATVDNARVWGGAYVITDSAQATVTGVGAGRQIVGAEYDMNAENTSTQIQGIALLGSSKVQPAGAAGFIVGQLDAPSASPGSIAGWHTGMGCSDGVIRVGAAYSCVNIGSASAAGTNIASQSLFMGYRDGVGAKFYNMQVDTAGNLNFTDSGTGHTLTANTNLSIGTNTMTIGLLSSNNIVTTGAVNNSSNYNAIYPASAVGTSYWTNHFAGFREIDFWNADTLATSTFRVYQKTGVSTATLVMEVDPKGSLVGNGAHISTGGFSRTDTTLTSITGLAQSLTAAGLYSCHGHVHFTTAPTTSNGLKVALATSDTLTVNTLNFTVVGLNGAAFATTGTGSATALGSNAIASTNVFTDLLLNAEINVNAAGTLQVQMAENVASGTIASTAGNARWECARAA